MHLLELVAPGDMEIVLDCKGKERFVALSWLDGFDVLVVYEGLQDEFGDGEGWKIFLQRSNVAKALKGYRLVGEKIGWKKKDAEHALILDKVTRRLWVCDIDPLVMEQEIKNLQVMHGIYRKNVGILNSPILSEKDVGAILDKARMHGMKTRTSTAGSLRLVKK